MGDDKYALDMVFQLHMLDDEFATYAGMNGATVSIERQTFIDQGRPVYVVARVPHGDKPLPDWIDI